MKKLCTAHSIKCRIGHMARRWEHLIHPVYFGLVFWEAHGFYGLAGGALGALAIVAMLTGGETDV